MNGNKHRNSITFPFCIFFISRIYPNARNRTALLAGWETSPWFGNIFLYSKLEKKQLFPLGFRLYSKYHECATVQPKSRFSFLTNLFHLKSLQHFLLISSHTASRFGPCFHPSHKSDVEQFSVTKFIFTLISSHAIAHFLIFQLSPAQQQHKRKGWVGKKKKKTENLNESRDPTRPCPLPLIYYYSRSLSVIFQRSKIETYVKAIRISRIEC